MEWSSGAGRINGGVICLDENGEVARWNLISGGGRITQSSSEMVEAYYRRREKQAEYEQIAEENALKRKLQEQEENERYYRSNSKKEAVLEAYQSQVIAPAVAVYENAISAFSNSVIENN